MKQLELLPEPIPPPVVDVRSPIEIYQELNAMPKPDDSEESIWNQCKNAIVYREIDESEAIDWLVYRGVDEDKAFKWAMKRFCGQRTLSSTSGGGLRAIKKLEPRSKRPKAA